MSASAGASTKLLFVVGIDYMHFAIPLLKKRIITDTQGELLCLALGEFSASGELATFCAKHGVQFVSGSNAILKAVVAEFAPTWALLALKEPGFLKVWAEATTLQSLKVLTVDYVAAEEPSGTIGEYVEWPEFRIIWGGATGSSVTISAVESDGLKVVWAQPCDVTRFETAISLRYKHVKALQDFAMIDSSVDYIMKSPSTSTAGPGSSGWAEAVSLMEWLFALPSHSAPKHADTEHIIDPAALTLGQADRYIRALTFPPYDSATLVSVVDGVEYFVETVEQYADYLVSAGLRDENMPLDLDSALPSIADCGVNVSQGATGNTGASNTPSNANKETGGVSAGSGTLPPSRGYAADTHWYSNVGGSIVLVKSEKAKMKAKASKHEVAIPGAAIAGTKKKLRMNEPLIGLTANHYVSSALTSGWIGVEGPHIKKFEAALSRICGVETACAVQSGTAALYGAMKALGVSEPMHHVLVPTYTCAWCADAIVHAGGVPIAVDCELDSYGMSFWAVEKWIELDPHVVGVVIAPSYGVPARDHVRIYQLCQEHGIWLCEDNCESYGAKMDIRLEPEDPTDNFAKINAQDWSNAQEAVITQPVGSMSTMSVVSVRSEKMVGVGEGGAILSKDPALVSKARWWCSRAPVRGCGLWRVYEHEEVGQNFRLPEVLGAVGLAACENLPVMVDRKRKIHAWYMQYLKPYEEKGYIKFQTPKKLDEPVWWLNSIKLLKENLPDWSRFNKGEHANTAESVGMWLMKKYPNIEIRPAFFPLHTMGTFAKEAAACPNAEEVYDTLFCVPSSWLLTEEDVKEVCNAVKECFAEVLGLPMLA